MSRIAWMSDLHLDHASETAIGGLLAELQATGADFVLVGGDIGEAPNFAGFLQRLVANSSGQVCFVLGNHDYYRSSIQAVRAQAEEVSRTGAALWLPSAELVELAPDTALVGHGGWGDARIGDVFGSDVFLNDYLMIDELRRVATPGEMTDELADQLNQLGDEAAAVLRPCVEAAVAQYANVYVLTHVPPFREACWHAGKISDDNWAPHFTCRAVGDMLRDVMQAHPVRRMTVLCGHTHGEGACRVLPNLEVRTAGAVYGEPRVYSVLDV